MRGFILTDVPCYKPWNDKGTVINCFSGTPRIFPSAHEAQMYARLSLFRDSRVEEILQ